MTCAARRFKKVLKQAAEPGHQLGPAVEVLLEGHFECGPCADLLVLALDLQGNLGLLRGALVPAVESARLTACTCG